MLAPLSEAPLAPLCHPALSMVATFRNKYGPYSGLYFWSHVSTSRLFVQKLIRICVRNESEFSVWAQATSSGDAQGPDD